jgi:lipoyl-dependent peroxiredoxin
MTTSSATATWEGRLRDGRGQFNGKSGMIQGSYSFTTRFEGAKGTNPEELIAAAHASCLSMALSAGLEGAGTPPTRITTTASATIDKVGDGFKITRMRLEVRGEVPGIDQAAFAKAAEAAKEGCPVSQALKGNVPFEFDARLA